MLALVRIALLITVHKFLSIYHHYWVGVQRWVATAEVNIMIMFFSGGIEISPDRENLKNRVHHATHYHYMISIPLRPCLCLPLSWLHCVCIPQQIPEQLWSARGFKTVSNSVFLILFSFPLGKWSTSMFISAIILVSNINKWRTVLRLVRWGSSHLPRCARVVSEQTQCCQVHYWGAVLEVGRGIARLAR